MSESPSSFTLEQLEPSAPLPLEAPERVIAEAYEQAEQIREQARAEGRNEGLAEGLQAGAEQLRMAVEALGAALSEIEHMRTGLMDGLEVDAVELALALAGKIVSGTLELEPERVLDVVRGALRRLGERRRITVLVDPSDLALVNGSIDQLRDQAGGIELCEVQADRRVGRGGAIVRTSESEIDVRVQTQLERAREVALGTDPAATLQA